MSYLTMRLLILQLFKNSIDTQGNLRLNLHSLIVSVSELLEYRRQCLTTSQFPQTFLTNPSKLRIYRCKIPTVITETLIV